MNDSNILESSRRALLSYYNSQTMTHGGYVIALAIGIATLISNWTSFETSSSLRVAFFITLSVFLAVSVYIIPRTLWWGYLATQVLNAKLDTESEKTIIYQLHEKTSTLTDERIRWAEHFHHFRWDIILAAFFILVAIFLLVDFGIRAS